MTDSSATPGEAQPTTRYQPLVAVLVALAGGIAADRYGSYTPVAWWVAGVVAWTVWLLLWRSGWTRLAAVSLLLAVACMGGTWHHLRWKCFDADELARAARVGNRPVCVEAVAVTGPRLIPAPPLNPMRIIPKGDESRLTVRIVRVRNAASWQPASGRATVTVEGQLLGVNPGDRLRIFAQMSRPAAPQNPGQFDLAAHQRADRKLCVLRASYPDCASVLARGSSIGLRRVVETVRSRANDLLWKHLAHERAGLAAAVLLGSREQLDYERKDAFLLTGTIHLLAISGIHVGMLACGFFLLARAGMMPRRGALLLVMILAVGYAVLTDARPPVVRATIFIVVACIAYLAYRRPLGFNTLALAAIIVLAINPADLFRTGAHLSFLAVATLIWTGRHWLDDTPADPLDYLIAQSRAWPVRATQATARWFGRLVWASTVIWLVALPLILYRMHLVSPAGMVLTAVVWIPMLLALNSGFGVIVFGWLVPPLGAVFGRICDANLWVLESTIRAAANVPGSYFFAPGPSLWWLAGFYGALAIGAALPRVRPPRRWCVAILAAWIAIGLAAPTLRPAGARPGASSESVDVTFLSVGHGTAAVIELPGGETILYDAGQFSSPAAATRSVAGYLWSRGIWHLDAVVLSHADSDHYNALPGLLERFSVGVVYVSPVMFEEDADALIALRESIERAGVPLREIYGGDRLATVCAADIEVLHPPRRGILGGDNANSIVLAIEHAQRRILLPGDLEPPGLEDVMAEAPTHFDVVMAPHHGSTRSNPAGFAEWCTPRWVVVSGGRSRSVDEVASKYEATGARVLRTQTAGAIRTTIGAAGVTVKHWRHRRWVAY